MRKPEVTKGCCVPKGWGEEIVMRIMKCIVEKFFTGVQGRL